MPYHTGKSNRCGSDKPVAVIKDNDGRIMGCHPNKESADRQIKAIEANENNIILEAASEANASESLLPAFVATLDAVRNNLGRARAADAGPDVARLWNDAVLEHVEPELRRLAAVMMYVACDANGLDPNTIAIADLDGLITEHLGGVQRYGQLIEGTLYRAASRDLLAFAGDALESVLAPSRAVHLADGIVTHFRNGVVYLVLNMAQPTPDEVTASATFQTESAVPADPFDRTKMWVTMRDDRVRRAHADTDGQVVPVSGVFTVGGSNARYPGDPTLPAGLRINCRCFMVRGDVAAGGPTEEASVDNDEVAALISGMVARQRQKLAAARRSRAAAEDPVADAAAAQATAEEAIAEIQTTLTGSPEAIEALSGGAAAGLMQSILEASAPELPLLIATLLGMLLEDDEEAEAPEFATGHPAADAAWVIATSEPAAGPLDQVTTFQVLDHSAGVMVCVRPTPDQAVELALFADRDGHPPEQMHVTLGYFGHVEDLGDDAQERMTKVVTAVVDDWDRGPIIGEVTGITVFEGNEELPLVAIVDAPGLGQLRARLVDAAAEMLGDEEQPFNNHDFTAHITLTYGADEADEQWAEARSLVGMALDFQGVELLFGTEPTVVPFEDGNDDPDREDDEMSNITTIPVPAGARRVTFDLAPDPVQLASTPAELDVGTEVSIDGADMTGTITDVVTDGVATDSQGNELEGTPDNPAYIVAVEDDVTMVAHADQLTPADRSGDEPEPDDEEMETTVTDPVQAADIPGLDDDVRSTLERRAEAGDFDYESVLIVEGAESGDRRFVNEGALTWRDLPLPLMLQTINPETGGHALAVIAGSIWQIDRAGTEIIGRGFFDSGPNGQEARRLIEEGTIKGVSADLDMVESDIEPTEDGTPRMRLTSGRLMGATITPFPAFQEAIIKVLPVLVAGAALAYTDVVAAFDRSEPLTDDELAGATTVSVWRSYTPFRGGIGSGALEKLVASPAGPVRLNNFPTEPPGAWFAKQQLDQRHPVNVDPDGRVWGHVAGWDECHIGFGERLCIMPPRSSTSYTRMYDSYQHAKCGGSVLTAEQQIVRTAPIFIDLLHDHSVKIEWAALAMEHTGCAIADVRAYEDEWGIQVAGAARPTASPEQIRVFRGSDVSPHWVRENGNLEMAGMICVNESGYPPPTLLVASAAGGMTEIAVDGKPHVVWNHETNEPDVLVAVGMVHRKLDPIEELREMVDYIIDLLGPQRAEAALKRIEQTKQARARG